MAIWNPPDKISDNEHVGRRLFDEPMLSGAQDQRPFTGISLTHFEETRGDEYSLDRLGRSGIDRKIVVYLKLRAKAAGQTFHKPKAFNGWAVLVARELINARKAPKLPIVASPVLAPEPNDNRYHAHVCRPPEVENPYFMALHLRYLFATYGKIEIVNANVPSFLCKIWGGISELKRRLFRDSKSM